MMFFSKKLLAVLALLPGFVFANEGTFALDRAPERTDMASLQFRNESELLAKASDPEREYREVVLPAKLALQAQYVEQAGLATDVRLIARTLKTLLGGR